jgi:hypothetical protein
LANSGALNHGALIDILSNKGIHGAIAGTTAQKLV